MIYESKKKEGFYYIDGEIKNGSERKHYHKESIKDEHFKSKKWCEEEEKRLVNGLKSSFVSFEKSKLGKPLKRKEIKKDSLRGRKRLGKERKEIRTFTIEPSLYDKIQEYCRDVDVSMSSKIALFFQNEMEEYYKTKENA